MILLYALTEEIGRSFGNSEGAIANAKIIMLMNFIKEEHLENNRCFGDDNTFGYLRVLVDKIVAQMTVPLVQKLIHNMQAEDTYGVELYGVALIGRLAGCSDSVYFGLLDEFVPLAYSNSSNFDDILKRLQSTYECLGITCADVGAYNMDVVEQCTDKDPDRPLAGYQPATDVYEHSKMDLDVYQIGVLLYMGAYDAAKEVFRYGGNSRYEDEDGYEVY